MPPNPHSRRPKSGLVKGRAKLWRKANQGQLGGARPQAGSRRHSRMILHGYFILGCVGDSVDDMLGIAPFAREFGLDTPAHIARIAREGAQAGAVSFMPGGLPYLPKIAVNLMMYFRRRSRRRPRKRPAQQAAMAQNDS